MAVGIVLGMGTGVSVSSGKGVGVGAIAVKVAFTITSTWACGTKTTCSGGLMKRLKLTRMLSTRHANRSWTGGRLYTSPHNKIRPSMPAMEMTRYFLFTRSIITFGNSAFSEQDLLTLI